MLTILGGFGGNDTQRYVFQLVLLFPSPPPSLLPLHTHNSFRIIEITRLILNHFYVVKKSFAFFFNVYT